VAKAEMFVTEAISEIILGYNWLREAECIWDFKNGRLTYCSTEVPLEVGRHERMYVAFTRVSECDCQPIQKLK